MKAASVSVRARIALAATIAVGLVLVIAGFVLVSVVRSSLEDPIAGEARVRATDVVAMAAGSALPSVIPAIPAPWPTLIQVLDSNGAVVSASAELQGAVPLLRPTPERREPSGTASIVFKEHRQHWQLNAVAANIQGSDVTVIVATSLAQTERTTRLIEVALLIGIPVLSAMVATLGWVLVSRALRPVEDLRREVAGFDQATSGRRLVEPPTDDEIARLARTLNALLGRLDTAHSRQRRFVADASHELRSPVANIRAALEIGLAHPDRTPWQEVAVDVLDQNARMGRLVDDLLLLARAEDGATTQRREVVDLRQIVERTVSSQTGRRVPVRLTGSDGVVDQGEGDAGAARGNAVLVRGDAVQLERVVENLLVNAVRHAASAVQVTVSRHGRWGVVAVADDGSGIPTEDRERIFERFVRLDQDRSPRGGGTGLGLAIVAEVTAAHGGTVAVTDASPGTSQGTSRGTSGGAIFTVRLPLISQGPLMEVHVQSQA